MYNNNDTEIRMTQCRTCNGVGGYIQRAMIDCPDCSGEGCIGMRQCHRCATDGRILADRHESCACCAGEGVVAVLDD